MSVDRTRIAVVGGPSKSGAVSTYSQTPASTTEGRDTPMYASGSRTPMYGSQTPLYDGSRTPHYGGMTPSHDGSRTPGQSGAWDPTVTNTPARSTDYGDLDNWDDQSPSPAYNPATPGSAYHVDTPQGPYTPHTPGTSYGSDHTYSPYQPSPSPAPYQASPSPSGYAPTPSPSTGLPFHPSPGMASSYTSPSPLSYSPMTPGVAPSPLNPQTPGAGMDSLSSQDWYTTDIEVRFKDSHSDAGLSGQVEDFLNKLIYNFTLSNLFIFHKERCHSRYIRRHVLSFSTSRRSCCNCCWRVVRTNRPSSTRSSENYFRRRT